MGKKVSGIGGLCLDVLAHTTRIPAKDMMSPLLGTSCQGGGKVPTALTAVKRLGVDAVLFATVGDDAAGRFCVQELQDSGVDVSHLAVIEGGQTNLTIALSEQETGGRSFIGRYDMRSILPSELDREVIKASDVLHLWDVSDAACQGAAWIREAGGKVVFDADRFTPEIASHLGIVDVFICSEFYFEGMFGKGLSKKDQQDALKELSSEGPGTVIVTLGDKGYAGYDSDGWFDGDAYHNITPVDTTGAGDVYHGAFIYGMLAGWDNRESAKFASAVSAIKCTVQGGRAGIPDLQTTRHFMETGQILTGVREKWEAYYKSRSIL